MMKSALIGYTGFVGNNLIGQAHFDDLYNSKNIGDACDREYDLLVCAAPSAEKWKANLDPRPTWIRYITLFPASSPYGPDSSC